MINHIEKEYKILVDKNNFFNLLSEYETTCIKQQNVYYDNDEHRLKQLKAGLRLRFKNNQIIFTLKVPHDNDLREYEKVVTCDNLNNLDDPELLQLLKDYDIKFPLHIISDVTTTRRLYQTEFYDLCFDENNFNGNYDYEIEYEYRIEHDGLSTFQSILAKIDYHYETNCLSKLQRSLIK